MVIDDQLVLRLPVSKAEVYRGRMTVPRLNLQPSDKLVDEALFRLRGISYDPILAENATMGVVPLHAEMLRMMQVGDRRRCQAVATAEEVPSTATWGLQSCTAFAFDEPKSAFRAAPTRQPPRHVAGTPDRVETNTHLPTTHAALCAMEELGRVNMANAALLLHILDEAEAVSNSPAGINVTDLFVRMRDAAGRMAAGAVDIHQVATYHRRWALLQGGSSELQRLLLPTDMGLGVSEILDVTKLPALPEQVLTPATPTQPITQPPAEKEEGRKPILGNGVPSTPNKLTVSDVESVLGVLKTVVKTPQSTSSLSSFVNRVSGTDLTDILNDLQNLGGGGGDAQLTTLENLNIT